MNINEELNTLDIYKNRQCYKCGATPSIALLNIEGMIHHGTRVSCINIKDCRRRQRKKK